MKVFYGAAIQGAKNRGERAHINRELIESIKQSGYEVFSEHTCGNSVEENARLLDCAIGPLPPAGIERTRYVRRKMIEAVEGDIVVAVFEASIPSTGTGVEIAHAYMRPRNGLTQIPVLVLYHDGYWPNGLSTMVSGLELPNVAIVNYRDLEDAKASLIGFLEEYLRK